MTRKKKMEEMAEQERQRQEKLRQQREEQARAERERAAREQEERHHRDAEENTERQFKRMQHGQFRKAAKKEDKRLRKRDETTWGAGTAAWSKKRAVLRFKTLAPVFETETFSETKPLTMRAVPWPVLTDPSDLCVEDIAWAQVKQFFAYYKQMEGLEPAEYRELVKKAHQFFHPESLNRWRSRAIIATILGEDVRLALEAAGNEVAQALTPVWMVSRQYK